VIFVVSLKQAFTSISSFGCLKFKVEQSGTLLQRALVTSISCLRHLKFEKNGLAFARTSNFVLKFVPGQLKKFLKRILNLLLYYYWS